MTTTSSTATQSAEIPASLETFSAALRTLAPPHPAGQAVVPIDYTYSWLLSDRTYGTDLYPSAGTFDAVTTPWQTALPTAAPDWLWQLPDTQAQGARKTEIEAQMAAMQPQPGQGTTAQQIAARYGSSSMWSSSVFSSAQLQSLFVWVDDDAEFARQRLGSANPNVISFQSSLDVAGLIDAAPNAADLGALRDELTTAQAAGALYVCDYRPVLAGVTTRTQSWLASPVALFTVVDNQLLPQAIVLDPGGSSYMFHPGDPSDPQGDAWLLAKLWVAHADAMWWFSGSHLFNTHSIDMIFGIAALRQVQLGVLPPTHPMLVLAKPHLVKSFNINNAVYDLTATKPGTGGIYQVGGFCDTVLPTGRIGIYEIINHLYQGYSFAGQAFPNTLGARGLTSGPIASVSFPYRDDGNEWWQALTDFVTSIVAATYPSDAAVAADTPLQAWMASVEQAFNHDGTTRWRWASNGQAATRADAVAAFSNLLFLCSVQHCAVNDAMFNAWAYTPNGPFRMQQPPPPNAAAVTQQLVLASLPDPAAAGLPGTSGPPQTDMGLIKSQLTFVMLGTPVIPGQAVAGEWLAGSVTQPLARTYQYPLGSRQAAAVIAFDQAVNGPGGVADRLDASQQRRIATYQQAHPGQPVPNSVSYPYLNPRTAASATINGPVTSAVQI